jgi:hypothetical protein
LVDDRHTRYLEALCERANGSTEHYEWINAVVEHAGIEEWLLVPKDLARGGFVKLGGQLSSRVCLTDKGKAWCEVM